MHPLTFNVAPQAQPTVAADGPLNETGRRLSNSHEERQKLGKVEEDLA
jgi:hypothetical protein